jgi:hypothetical protein
MLLVAIDAGIFDFGEAADERRCRLRHGTLRDEQQLLLITQPPLAG